MVNCIEAGSVRNKKKKKKNYWAMVYEIRL